MREHPRAWHEGGEHSHDEAGLQNHYSLLGIAIEPQRHEIYGFKKVTTKTNRIGREGRHDRGA